MCVPFGWHVVVRWFIYALTFLLHYDADEPLVLSRHSDPLLAGRSGDRILVEVRFPAPVQTGPEALPAPSALGIASLPPGVKRSGRGVYHPPPPSADVKEGDVLYIYSASGTSYTFISELHLYLHYYLQVLTPISAIGNRLSWFISGTPHKFRNTTSNNNRRDTLHIVSIPYAIIILTSSATLTGVWGRRIIYKIAN